MRSTYSSYISFGLLAFSSLMFAACSQDINHGDEENNQKVKFRLGLDDYVKREIRGIATPQEEEVRTLDVVFFQGNNKKIVPGAHTTGTHYGVFHYDLTSPNPGEWVNGSVSSQTVYLDTKAADVNGTTAVALVNLPAAVQSKLVQGAAGEITTLSDLKDAVSQTITRPDEIGTPLLMTGEAAASFSNPALDNQIEVSLKRAVARLDVELIYDWDKLVPSKEKGKYAFQQFGNVTKVGTSDNLTAARVDGLEKELALTTTAAPTSKFSTYINEYDYTGSTYTTTPAPYILLELPALLGDDSPLAGIYPPPAGGDFNRTPVKSYYKVVLPRYLKRNCAYTLQAHVVGSGSPSKEGAIILQFSLKVRPWESSIVPTTPITPFAQ